MDFAGKTVWITGASSGLGEALVYKLSNAGASVILSGRRLDALQRVAAKAGPAARVLAFEAADFDSLPAMVNRAWGEFGQIDMLINNAGIGQRSLALDTELDTYRRLIDVNVLGPICLTQLLLPRMIAAGEGHIVAMSSIAAIVGAPLRSGYAASKHAVLGYFDVLRAEVERAHGIKVSVILCGSARTSLAINAITGDGSTYGKTDESIENGMASAKVAETVVSALAEGQREIVVAEGLELHAARLRATDPDQVFDYLAEVGAQLATDRLQHLKNKGQ